MSILSIAELALGFSANTCFGLMGTKWGDKNQARLGKGSIAFGLASLALGIFGQAIGRQAAPPSLTKQDLTDATDALRSELADDRFAEALVDRLAPLQVAAVEVGDAISLALVDARSREPLDPELDDILNRDWEKYYASFADQAKDGYQFACLETCRWVEDQPERKYQSMDLYVLAGSLYLNLCQLSLMVEWNAYRDSPHAGETWQAASHQYRKAYKAYKADHARWLEHLAAAEKAADTAYAPPAPFGRDPVNPGIPSGSVEIGPEPQPPEPPPMQPDGWEMLTTSIHARNIAQQVAAFLTYAEPVVAEMEKMVARHEQVEAFVGQPEVRKVTFKGYDLGMRVFNPATEEAWNPAPPDIAQRQRAVMEGIERAGLLDDPLVATHHLTRKQVDDLNSTLENWRKTKDAYAFALTGAAG